MTALSTELRIPIYKLSLRLVLQQAFFGITRDLSGDEALAWLF